MISINVTFFIQLANVLILVFLMNLFLYRPIRQFVAQRNKFVAELVATAIARHEDKLAKIAVAVTNEEKRNPNIAREMRDWEATAIDGLEEKHGARAKPQTR